MTHLSLFSGIGGLDLAAEWAGFTTVGQCEFADYPTKVLEKHWPDVPRWRDIRTLTKESFYERTGQRTVDVISGGFPCQPFSVAGKQKGKDDDRYLWPEMLRVIRELRPRCVVGENVSGLIRIALAEILSELQIIGYEARGYSSAARDVGGLHKGERIFIVAAANDRSAAVRGNAQLPTNGSPERCGDHHGRGTEKPDLWKRWEVEPRPYGVAHGIPHRVDRLKCLGNAVVPQQAYPIFKALAEELQREDLL
ncbi:MAG: DNA (cytosine-5-)-methyltransferase [Dialister sp.]|nr:DNA (cytosine-5-)-methyltransferase [Dialister sp.]